MAHVSACCTCAGHGDGGETYALINVRQRSLPSLLFIQPSSSVTRPVWGASANSGNSRRVCSKISSSYLCLYAVGREPSQHINSALPRQPAAGEVYVSHTHTLSASAHAAGSSRSSSNTSKCGRQPVPSSKLKNCFNLDAHLCMFNRFYRKSETVTLQFTRADGQRKLTVFQSTPRKGRCL